ncbi:MAG: ATP-binding cassette domain-containing protein [Propionicimonas sp.]
MWWPNPVTAIVALACSYLIRFVAAIGVGAHLIATTSPTALAAGLRAWRAPRPIAVTLAVMLRFFPVVNAEATAVLDAMRLRGLAGATGILRHPILTLERFTVPMIAASLRASEDLSASAILRGLGSHRKPTAMYPPRFGDGGSRPRPDRRRIDRCRARPTRGAVMLNVADVSWRYPYADQPSLRELGLRIEPGQFVILCGASGSGKSTALRLLNGLIPHFHDEGVLTGTVTVDGLLTTDAELDAIGLVTGTVLQHPRRQFFTESVPEELAFAMENFGFPSEQIRTQVGQTVEELAASVPIDQPLKTLSGGQQQQVAIAAATAHRPRVLLLDEPSSNLSADAVHRLTATLAELKAQGVTIVVAEHRLRYLEGLADRVIVLRDGAMDVEWTAAQFRAVPDEELAREGLRGLTSSVLLPTLPAAGASIAGGVEPDAVPSGALELDGLRCRLGGRLVVSIDRAAFAAGEVTAIRGVNGAGKSTLARIVTGLQRSAGRVRLDGRELSPRTRQRGSAIVMQDVQRQLFTDSVAAEIELAAAGSAPSLDTGEVLTALDLSALAERHPLSLSGGQQQRLVVAAVRVAGRRIVVFDEPSSGVDRRHLQSISDQIREVAADGAVVLLISHDDDLLALAADRQLTLVPAEADWRPATEEVR